ncbi:type II toxin-antitoxin system mRNA interferase toxin, RelE/StbE family [Candidatus Micrarchaeota archaeon]|nr:type II toxin-antitoxin system mRNA interferase toxin, RelE/StbE family [Candidatus Micrarchaeota archaeon]
MSYKQELSTTIYKKFKKLAKKDKVAFEAVAKKVEQILENPHQFKPLRFPMQGLRRVQIGSFVLTYKIEEASKTVVLLDYEHHDKVYG